MTKVCTHHLSAQPRLGHHVCAPGGEEGGSVACGRCRRRRLGAHCACKAQAKLRKHGALLRVRQLQRVARSANLILARTGGGCGDQLLLEGCGLSSQLRL